MILYELMILLILISAFLFAYEETQEWLGTKWGDIREHIAKENTVAGGSDAEILATYSYPYTTVKIFFSSANTSGLAIANYYYDLRKSVSPDSAVLIYGTFVSDTGAADTVLVCYPITAITGTTDYALCGSIKEIATNNMVTGLYGSADAKVYVIWLPNPRAVRFTLSQYASGKVYVKTIGKPN